MSSACSLKELFFGLLNHGLLNLFFLVPFAPSASLRYVCSFFSLKLLNLKLLDCFCVFEESSP